MDQALKQRLVGATVLIILAVILLPMLLSGQPELQNESRRIELPDKPPELSIDTRRFPIGQQDSAQPSRVPETMPSREIQISMETWTLGISSRCPTHLEQRVAAGRTAISPVMDLLMRPTS